MAWNLENSVALGREGTGFAQILKQPSLKELTTSPYEAMAKKALAKKTDEFKITDVNPTAPIPEDQALVDNEVKNYYTMASNFQRQGMTAGSHPNEYAALQQQKQKVENTALYSADYGKKEADMIKKINADKYSYPPNSIDLINQNRALPLFDANGNRVRELDPANLFPKIDNINVNQEIKKFGYPSYHSEAIANWNGLGGGKSKREFVFDEKAAGRSYFAATANDSDKGYMVKLTKRAADEAKAAYNKNPLTTLGNTWDDLSDTDKDAFVDAKRQAIYIDTLRDLAKQDEAEVNRANKIYKDRTSGGGGGTPLAGKGFYEVKSSLNDDGTFNKTQIVNLNTVASKTAVDTKNPENYFLAENGETISGPIHPTGKVIKKQDGIWMVEVEALDSYTNPLTKKTVKAHDRFEIPYEQNKRVLQKYGYQTIDEIKSPEERKKQYDASQPTPPSEFNKTTADPKKRADYKKKYEKWKASGWKNKSTAHTKVKAEEAINNQVASLTNQENKVGTYNPLTGQITFA